MGTSNGTLDGLADALGGYGVGTEGVIPQFVKNRPGGISCTKCCTMLSGGAKEEIIFGDHVSYSGTVFCFNIY